MMTGYEADYTNSGSDQHHGSKNHKRKYDHMSYGVVAVILMIGRQDRNGRIDSC